MSGLPRVAVVGVDATGAAAIIALVDGGLPVSAFSLGPAPSTSLTMLAAHGLVDRVTAVDPGTARLAALGAATPGFEMLGTPNPGPPPASGRTGDAPASPATATATGPASAGVAAAAAGAVAGPKVLGVFDAAILADPGGALCPGGVDTARFGGVFDLDVPWLFHVTGPAELATARSRWIGEYLRGRYLPPPHAVMVAHPQLPGRSLRGGTRGQLATLERELRAGHGRAAEAGYPLPSPPPSVSAPAT